MLSLTGVAYVISYSTTVKFKSVHSGAMREFNRENISYSATMNSSKSNDTGTYTVYLERKSEILATDVGHKTLNRVGKGSANWSNVGAQKYRLSFKKR